MRALCLLALALVACGGADQTTILDGGSDTGTGSDATTTGDSATGKDGATGNDGATTNDASLSDSGNPTTIPCGNTSCTGNDVCCVDTQNQQTTYTCAATCPNNATALKCIGGDCGPEVCCVYVDSITQQTASKCEVACGNNEAQLCQNTDAGPTGCSSTAPCSSQNIGDWGLTQPFGTCGGIGN